MKMPLTNAERSRRWCEAHPEESAARHRRYRANHPEKQRAVEEARKRRDPEGYAEKLKALSELRAHRYKTDPMFRKQACVKARENHLKKKFGITTEQFDEMVIAQLGLCAVCENPMISRRGASVDHNHKTGQVRALLCNNCNTGIGLLKENPKTLLAAVAYLAKWS